MPEYPSEQHRRDHADRHATGGPDELDPSTIGAASTAALAAHEADTTSIHGIADTAALVVDGDAAGGDLAGTYPNPTVVEANVDHAGLANLTTGDPHTQYLLESALAFADFTPTLTASTTNPTLGSGAIQEGRLFQLGTLAIATVFIKFGTSGVDAGSGTYRISLPVTARSLTANERRVYGTALVFDNSGGSVRSVTCRADGTSDDETFFAMTDEFSLGLIDHDSPWVWAASDTVTATLTYETA